MANADEAALDAAAVLAASQGMLSDLAKRKQIICEEYRGNEQMLKSLQDLLVDRYLPSRDDADDVGTPGGAGAGAGAGASSQALAVVGEGHALVSKSLDERGTFGGRIAAGHMMGQIAGWRSPTRREFDSRRYDPNSEQRRDHLEEAIRAVMQCQDSIRHSIQQLAIAETRLKAAEQLCRRRDEIQALFERPATEDAGGASSSSKPSEASHLSKLFAGLPTPDDNSTDGDDSSDGGSSSPPEQAGRRGAQPSSSATKKRKKKKRKKNKERWGDAGGGGLMPRTNSLPTSSMLLPGEVDGGLRRRQRRAEAREQLRHKRSFLDRMRQPRVKAFFAEIRDFIADFNERAAVDDSTNSTRDDHDDGVAATERDIELTGFLRHARQRMLEHPSWAGATEALMTIDLDEMESFVMTQCLDVVMRSLRSRNDRKDRELLVRMKVLRSLPPEAIKVPMHLLPAVSGMALGLACAELRQMKSRTSPVAMLACVQRSAHIVSNAISAHQKRQREEEEALVLQASTDGTGRTIKKKKKSSSSPAGADEFLPLFIYVVVHSEAPQMHACTALVSTFRDPGQMLSQAGYCFATLCTAIDYIMHTQGGLSDDAFAEACAKIQSTHPGLRGFQVTLCPKSATKSRPPRSRQDGRRGASPSTSTSSGRQREAPGPGVTSAAAVPIKIKSSSGQSRGDFLYRRSDSGASNATSATTEDSAGDQDSEWDPNLDMSAEEQFMMDAEGDLFVPPADGFEGGVTLTSGSSGVPIFTLDSNGNNQEPGDNDRRAANGGARRGVTTTTTGVGTQPSGDRGHGPTVEAGNTGVKNKKRSSKKRADSVGPMISVFPAIMGDLPDDGTSPEVLLCLQRDALEVCTAVAGQNVLHRWRYAQLARWGADGDLLVLEAFRGEQPSAGLRTFAFRLQAGAPASAVCQHIMNNVRALMVNSSHSSSEGSSSSSSGSSGRRKSSRRSKAKKERAKKGAEEQSREDHLACHLRNVGHA